MRRLILVSLLTTVLLSACGRKSVEPPPATKVATKVGLSIPALTVRSCRLGEQHAAIVIAKGEFQDLGHTGFATGTWIYVGRSPQFSKEVVLRWECYVQDDLSGTLRFEPGPGEFWPHETFHLRNQTFDLAEGAVFVVNYTDSPEPPPGRVRRSGRVEGGSPAAPAETVVAESRQVEITQLIRPWRDLSVDQLTEAIASDEQIRSLTTVNGESQGRPEQAGEQPRPE